MVSRNGVCVFENDDFLCMEVVVVCCGCRVESGGCHVEKGLVRWSFRWVSNCGWFLGMDVFSNCFTSC